MQIWNENLRTHWLSKQKTRYLNFLKLKILKNMKWKEYEIGDKKEIKTNFLLKGNVAAVSKYVQHT